MGETVTMKKVTKEEAAKLDRTKMGVCLVQQPQADVEGQIRVWKQIQCPWCGNYFWICYDSEDYNWHTCPWCGNPLCGNPFRA